MSRDTTLAGQLLADHLVEGHLQPGTEIGLRVDQTLTQDATGTLVMQELEALGLGRAKTEVSVQYVDHNLLQADEKNAEDHEYLRSACRRFGIWFSKAGNGVSHPTHMQRFGKPGKTLAGSDSHTCAAGSLGMLAIGVGGLEVAMAIAGEPLYLRMPEIWGVRLTGELPDWVSAKDVVLEMLRRHGVSGGRNRIIEYHGPGLAGLSAMDRHVIANMGAEPYPRSAGSRGRWRWLGQRTGRPCHRQDPQQVRPHLRLRRRFPRTPDPSGAQPLPARLRHGAGPAARLGSEDRRRQSPCIARAGRSAATER